MQHFTYHYDQDLQCLVKATQEGQEVQRIFIPFCDLEKVCAILWHNSAERIFTERE
jgi:hypothetical protein